MSYNVILGNNLRRNREQSGMSQEELSKESSISVELISDIESGKHSPSYWTVAKLSFVIGCNRNNIYPGIYPNEIPELSKDEIDRLSQELKVESKLVEDWNSL